MDLLRNDAKEVLVLRTFETNKAHHFGYDKVWLPVRHFGREFVVRAIGEGVPHLKEGEGPGTTLSPSMSKVPPTPQPLHASADLFFIAPLLGPPLESLGTLAVFSGRGFCPPLRCPWMTLLLKIWKS